MTLDDLITQLQRLEKAVQQSNPYAGEVVLSLHASGAGYVMVLDTVYGEYYPHHTFTFGTLLEMETILAVAVASLETDA